MSLLNYLNNEQDFLTKAELTDLYNTDLLTHEEMEKLLAPRLSNSYIDLFKSPIYSSKEYDDERIIDDAILYKKCSSCGNSNYILLDRISKSFIHFGALFYDLYDFGYRIANRDIKNNLPAFLKKELGELKIYSHEDLKKELEEFINNKEKSLMKENHSFLYEQGKKETSDIESLDKQIINELKILYIFNEPLEEKYACYIKEYDSEFYNMKDRYPLFMINYLRSKDYISQLVEEEFYKCIGKENKNKHNNERFYKYERERELQTELRQPFEVDKKLNLYKAIYEATKLAGKTITVNGNKYENHVCKVYGTQCIDSIEIGRFGNYIKFEDVKTITFGRKTLFDINNY